DIADLEHDRAVGIHHDSRATVTGLDRVAARDLGEDRIFHGDLSGLRLGLHLAQSLVPPARKPVKSSGADPLGLSCKGHRPFGQGSRAEHDMSPDYETEYNNRARVPEHPGIIAGWASDAEAYR